MTWFYSASTNGFYTDSLHGSAMPSDVLAITDERRQQLLQGQAALLNIQPGPDGLPVLVARDITAVPVPSKISRAQGRLALFRAGLWPQVLAYVDAITDPAEQFEADNALNHTTDWERASPFLARAAGALGLSTAALDSLFVEAFKIVP